MIVIRGRRSATRDSNSIAHSLSAAQSEAEPDLLVRRHRLHLCAPAPKAVTTGYGIDSIPMHEGLVCAYRESSTRGPGFRDE
jgi:hypothetical protein